MSRKTDFPRRNCGERVTTNVERGSARRPQPAIVPPMSTGRQSVAFDLYRATVKMRNGTGATKVEGSATAGGRATRKCRWTRVETHSLCKLMVTGK